MVTVVIGDAEGLCMGGVGGENLWRDVCPF